MSHVLAGKPAPDSMLVNVPRLVSAYYTDPPQTGVSFGTSGHRGSSEDGAFNELHIAATSQALCEYRAEKGVTGPLFLGFDTHALSEPAFRTALEVFAANGVQTVVHQKDEYTPTPVISFLILEYNRGRTSGLADGVVVTPSHNPPRDGGFKYNPPNGGPADVDATDWVQNRANQIMKAQSGVKRMPYQKARLAENTHEQDFITPFVDALPQVVDLTAIKNAGLRLGADPLGGSGVHFWSVIADKHGLDLEVVNTKVDPTFGFMTLDADGLIRMDCSSPYAMANLISLAGRFDVAFGNDPDFDRHGIVCPTGLMNPNHYLSTVIWYLIQNRPDWPKDVQIGKTLVGSSMMDKVALSVGRRIYEVPVGFKWFVDGLMSGRLAMGLEESAGGAFLRFDGRPWTTDKDGFTLALLAAEILAKTGRTPAEIYKETLAAQFGEPWYNRVDGPITEERKAFLKSFTPAALKTDRIAGQKIVAAATTAQGNNAPIGGVKVSLEDGSWFAIRPSGTEPKMKIYIESFGGEPLWQKIAEEAAPAVFGE